MKTIFETQMFNLHKSSANEDQEKHDSGQHLHPDHANLGNRRSSFRFVYQFIKMRKMENLIFLTDHHCYDRQVNMDRIMDC